jgi:hypothetical protein
MLSALWVYRLMIRPDYGSTRNVARICRHPLQKWL